MAEMAATDLTYTINTQASLGVAGKVVDVKIVFGDGALTYPAGGVPLTKGKMGCPVVLHQFVMSEQTSSVSTVWKYDDSAATLRAYVMSTAAEFGGAAIDAQEIHGLAIGY